MVEEAEQFAEEDKKVKDRIDGRNGLEGYCYNLKNTLEELLHHWSRRRRWSSAKRDSCATSAISSAVSMSRGGGPRVSTLPSVVSSRATASCRTSVTAALRRPVT